MNIITIYQEGIVFTHVNFYMYTLENLYIVFATWSNFVGVWFWLAACLGLDPDEEKLEIRLKQPLQH